MEKRHFFDPAITCALLKLTPQKLMNDLNTFGFMFEALVERDLEIYAESLGAKLYHYQDYNNNEIDAVIEFSDGSWGAFEIKLGLAEAEEGTKKLTSICNNIIENGGVVPKFKCLVYGSGNMIYKTEDNVYIVPITSFKKLIF